MDDFRATILLGLIITVPVHAGVVVEEIFDSGFEGIEACADFDAQGDNVLVPVINISGDFTLNGGAFPAIEFDDANISLRDRRTGDVFEIGNTHDQSYSVNIVPGYYDVLYSVETQGPEVPRNTDAVLMEGVLLLESQTLDIPVTAYKLSGFFRLNGVLFPGVEYDDAEIWLSGEQTGTLLLGETKFQSYVHVPVLPGNYEIRYKVQTIGLDVPLNQWGFVGPLSVTGNNAALNINVSSIEVSGDFDLNGAPMPAVDYDDGNFYLETAAGDRAFLGNSHDQSYATNVIPGTYDVYWEVESRGPDVPTNDRARIATGEDIGSGNLDIDVIAHQMFGNITLNNGAFPNMPADTGRIYLRDQATGDDTEIGLTYSTPSYDLNVVESTYEFVYSHGQGDNVPQNDDAVVGSFALLKASEVNINVPARRIFVDMYHNGALFTSDASHQANIELKDRSSPDTARLGRTSQQNLSALLVPGRYDVYYSHLIGADVPLNSNALIYENLAVEEPPPVRGGGGLQIHVNSLQINGQMLLNDAPFPMIEFDDGEVWLARDQDTILLGNTHDQTYDVRLIDLGEPTYYEVYYGAETRGPEVPINNDAYAMCIVLDPLPLP